MPTFEFIPNGDLTLPSGKVLPITRMVSETGYADSIDSDEGDISLNDFERCQLTDLPEDTRIYIYRFSDIQIDNVDWIVIKRVANNLEVELAMTIFYSKWHNQISPRHFFEQLANRMSSDNEGFRHSERSPTDPELITQYFYFTTKPELDIYNTLRVFLGDFVDSIRIVLSTFGSRVDTRPNRLFDINASTGIGINDTTLKRWLSGKNRSLAYIAIVVLFCLAIVGLIADLKEIFS